jgi:hypothetical protein
MENQSKTKTNAWYASKMNLGIPKFFNFTTAETSKNSKTNLFTKNWLILLVLMFGLFANNHTSQAQQVIGSFPYFDGGFEGQTVGALGTTLSATAWSRQSQTGASTTISTTTPRTGTKYATIVNVATASRGLQSPQTATPANGPAASTSYTIQYFIKNPSIASYTESINTNGTTNTAYGTAVTVAANASWTLRTVTQTSATTAVTTAGILVTGRSASAVTFDIDDVVLYAGAADASAPNSPGSVTVGNPSASTLDVSWGAASGGVDGGGYVVVRYATSPNADNDPNQNGIYAVGNTTTNGTGSLTGTVRYIGTGTSFTDNVGLSASTTYYYKVYTVDKAFNYSAETQSSGTTTASVCSTADNVTSLTASVANLQSVLSWTNGSCFDEMMVVASSSSFTAATPTGNGSAYTANSASFTDGLNTTFDGGKVVYKGAGTTVTVTSLTNGTLYNIKVFTRRGTTWNSGVSTTVTPALNAYYWNGASIAASPAAGGTGSWGTANSWRQPTSTGSQATWTDNNPAIVAGTAGILTIEANRIVTSLDFQTSGYTLTPDATTARTITGPTTVVASGVLNLNDITSTANRTISFLGNVSGGAGASLNFNVNQLTGSTSRINLASAGATLSLPSTVTAGANAVTFGNMAIVGTSTGTVMTAAATITNNTSYSTSVGATSGNDLTVNGVISGSAPLMFAAGSSGGAGTVTINSTNTYTGGTIFNMANSGIIRLGTATAFPSSTAVSMGFSASNGGIWDLNSFSPTIASLTSGVGGGSITNNNAGTGTSTLTINGSSSTTFGLPITNGATAFVALTKQGTSTLTLSAINTYTGATSVTGGTLLVNGVSTGASATTVGASGTFGGSGTSPGTLSVTGTLAPGSTGTTNAGTLTTGAQTWNTGATYNLTITNVTGTAGTNWDYVTTTGTSNFGTNTTNIVVGGTVTGFSDITSYTWKILTATGGISGFNAANFTLNTTAFGAFTGAFSVAQSGNDVNLIYTPLAVSISVGALTPGGAFSTSLGSASAVQTFTISGANVLTVSVAALAGYEYSDDGFTTAGQSSLSYGAAVSFSKTISVRLTGASGGTFNGNIVVSATGASTPTGSPSNVAVLGTVAAPSITLSSPSQIAAGNLQQGSLDQPVSNFQVAVATVTSTLNSVQFLMQPGGGTFASSNITNFKLWYNPAGNFFSSALQIGSSITSIPASGATATFSGLTTAITAGNTGYFWITASLPAGAVVGNTLNIGNHTLTFAAGSPTGSIAVGGNQVIIAQASTFTTGNILVEVVGDGTVPSGNALPVNIAEYFPTTNQTTAFSTTPMLALATAPTSPNYNVVESGTGTSQGYLNRSADGTMLNVPGFNSNLGVAVASSVSTSLPTNGRTIGLVSPSRVATSPTTLNVFSGSNYRSLVSNGFSYWMGGNGGINYVFDAASTTSTALITGNQRVVNIFNNNLYYSTGSAPAGVYQLNASTGGLPTAATSGTALVAASNPYAFSINPASTIMYVANDAVYISTTPGPQTTSGGGILKYTWSGSAWVFQYALQMRSTTAGARGVTVDWSGSVPVLYVTTNETTPNTVIRIVDNGQTSGNSGTLLATAGSNRIFRGVAFAPIATAAPKLFSTANTFVFPTTEVGQVSTVQTFNASGYNLGAATNLTVSVPSGYFVSTNSTGPFSSTSATANVTAGVVNAPFYIQFAPGSVATFAGNVTVSSAGSSATNVLVPITGSGINPTLFYLRNGGTLSNTADWSTNTNGLGGTQPLDFVTANQGFVIANNATVTLSGTWTVSGLNTSVRVGDGSSSTNFTVAAAATYSAVQTRVNNLGTLTLQNATVPTLGQLASGSTVVYNQTGAANVANVAYHNLTLLGSAGAPTFTLPSTGTSLPLVVAGDLVVNGANAIGTNTAPFTYVQLTGNLSGLNGATFGVASPQNSGNIFSLITSGNGNQTLSYPSGTMRFFSITSTKSAGIFNIAANTTVETFNQSGFFTTFTYSGTSSITTGTGSLLRGNVNGNMNFVITGSANMTLGGNLSTTGTGGSTLATPVGTSGSIFFDVTGSAVFSDGGNTIAVSNNLGMKGASSNYNLTGTVSMEGTALSVSPKIEDDNSNQGVINAQLNNLVIAPNGCTNIDFQPGTGSANITIKGNLTVNTGTMTGSIRMFGNTLKVGGNITNNRTAAIFSAANATLEFNGTAPQSYSTSNTAGDNFNIVKLSNASGLTLSSGNINITGTASPNLNVSSGVITTTGTNKFILSNTATITETAAAYVNGLVQTTRVLASATNETFGGLGLEINAAGAAPGSTVVLRETGVSKVIGCYGASVKRNFTVTPTTNAGLNATVVYRYVPTLAGELNGITESTLGLYTTTGTAVLPATLNTGANTITTTLNVLPSSFVAATLDPTLSGVTVSSACEGSTSTVTLNGLIPGATFTVAYSIGSTQGSATAQTPATGVVSTGGIGTFLSGPLSNFLNGQNLYVTSLSRTDISPNCTKTFNSSNSATLSVSSLPTAVAGGSQTICENGTATVPSATATNGTILWTHNGSGQFADDGTGNPGATSTLLTPTYVAAASDAGLTRTLTMTVSNAPCANATATHTVVVKAIPTASAGSNGSICQNGTFTVTGSSASNGTILWTRSGAGLFANNGFGVPGATSTLLAPTYTAAAGDAGNTVVLTLTVSNSPCSNAVSTANVSVGTAPTASVTGSAPHAVSCENGIVTVSGVSATNVNSVSWSIVSGAGSITSGGSSFAPTYQCNSGDAGQNVILRMTATGNAPCNLVQTTVDYVINVKPRPTVALTLGPNAICNDGNGVARKLTVSNSEANTTYLWSPATDLYVDAAFTTPYTNQNVTEVWAVPFVTSSYSVTATNNTSLCTTPASIPTTLTVCTNLTDLICGATDIAVNSTGAWTTISLIGSTASAGIPCAVVERDVYRRVQVPASGELHVTTAAGTNSTSSLNIQRTLVSIHYAPGGSCTNSPSIACNSTGAAGNHSYVYATGLTPGEYAWIRIAKSKANVSDPNTVAQELRIIVAPGLTWTGSSSTAFANPSNWLNGDATAVTVPDLNKSVLIRQVTNAPVVSSNEQIRGLIMSSGAGLSINTSNTLSISRYLQTANNTVGGLGWTVLNGSSAQAINTTVRFNNLRVNNTAGVNITAATRVGGLDLQQGVVTTNNNLTLFSEAGLTGYVNNFSGGYTGSLSGNVNVERRVVLASATAGVDHYLASPVDMVGTVSSNYNDDLPVVGNPSNYVYNSSPNVTQPSTFPSTWTWNEALTGIYTPGWTGAGGTTLAKGQGFSAKVTSTRIIDINGVANNGSIDRTITYTDDGLNLIGNPYPSSINFNSFANANSATILPVLYIWNPASSTYASYNGTAWTNNPAGALSSDVIAHSQSFFVFAKPAVAPSGTVNFNNTMRTTSQAANFFSAPEGLIRLEVSSNGYTDEAVVMTNAEATENYDEQVDAKKLLNAMNPNILAFTLSADNTPLAINALDKFNTEQVIPVQIVAPNAGEVNIKLNLSDLQERYENIYLEDATLGTYTDLKARGSYTATVSAGNSGSRFFLHFEKPSVAKAANELGVYAANSTVFVNITSESNGTIEVIDLVGKTIYTSNFSGKSGRVAFEVPNAVYGTYLVKLTSNGKVVNQKVVLNQ